MLWSNKVFLESSMAQQNKVLQESSQVNEIYFYSQLWMEKLIRMVLFIHLTKNMPKLRYLQWYSGNILCRDHIAIHFFRMETQREPGLYLKFYTFIFLFIIGSIYEEFIENSFY